MSCESNFPPDPKPETGCEYDESVNPYKVTLVTKLFEASNSIVNFAVDTGPLESAVTLYRSSLPSAAPFAGGGSSAMIGKDFINCPPAEWVSPFKGTVRPELAPMMRVCKSGSL